MPTTLGTRHQDRVKASQGVVNGGGSGSWEALTGIVIENCVAALLGVALLAYLVYALVRPERF